MKRSPFLTRFEGKATGGTVQPSIFAADDILSFEGKINLLLRTFQDAANAVNSIKTYLELTAYRHGLVSSHNELNRPIIEKQLISVLSSIIETLSIGNFLKRVSSFYLNKLKNAPICLNIYTPFVIVPACPIIVFK